MMDFQDQHPLRSYWDMILASVGANAMASALELGVFDELGTPVRGADVAGRLGLHEQMLEHLLRLLCSLGLVRSMESQCGDETAALYEAGSIARRYFMKDSPFYCGDSWQFRFSSLSRFGSQISSRVRTGPDVDTFPEGGVSDQCWATLTRTRIVQEQAAITAVAAADIVRNLPEVGRIGRFLDLGGGAGVVAVALAQVMPKATGVVVELPPTAEVVRKNVDESGLSGRISIMSGDLEQVDFGHGYGLVWCSSVLHFIRDMESTIRKVRSALAPGGVFVSAHAEIPGSPADANPVLSYYLPLLMRGHHVGEEGELGRLFRAGGFERVDSFTSNMFPLAPVRIHVCR